MASHLKGRRAIALRPGRSLTTCTGVQVRPFLRQHQIAVDSTQYGTKNHSSTLEIRLRRRFGSPLPELVLTSKTPVIHAARDCTALLAARTTGTAGASLYVVEYGEISGIIGRWSA